jgi:hypothetical protein
VNVGACFKDVLIPADRMGPAAFDVKTWTCPTGVTSLRPTSVTGGAYVGCVAGAYVSLQRLDVTELYWCLCESSTSRCGRVVLHQCVSSSRFFDMKTWTCAPGVTSLRPTSVVGGAYVGCVAGAYVRLCLNVD